MITVGVSGWWRSDNSGSEWLVNGGGVAIAGMGSRGRSYQSGRGGGLLVEEWSKEEWLVNGGGVVVPEV